MYISLFAFVDGRGYGNEREREKKALILCTL